ncbi:hypothetical protein K9857_04840 [Pseudomonas sp. REP124]|uniref:hypothetical protein n=1 Tax=Pseudomonas sp. REP124 TaxID=2875731 RepID=UPI001CC9473E|nr:hypothetical protein [Pseudomonas sp. REP124]MBZ9780877.1 hypothetical protein [Pseudomonas sp. REP124]
MKYETSVVYLEQIPKIVVDTGFDWSNLWTFFATVLVFMLGTYLTIRNFNKTVASQEALAAENAKIQRENISSQELIAKQGSLKASRQNWINELRDTCAQYIAAALNVQQLNVYREAAQPSWNLQRINDSVIANEVQADWSVSHIQAMKELVSLKAKLELLLNPEEVDSKEFMKAVNELHKECDQPGGPAKAVAGNVVYWCQHILKQEWEKAKAGK